MEKTYNVSEAAKKIGVSVKTLQRWDRDGKLVANRTPSNRRYYTDSQLKNIKEDTFDTKDMIETIKNKYENMKKHGMTMENANVMYHVIYSFCTMQDTDRIDFFDSYDHTTMDGEYICTCDIIIEDKSSMSIITSPTKTNKYSPSNNGKNQMRSPRSPVSRNKSNQKITIVLSTPPRSSSRIQSPVSKSPKRVRFSVFPMI